jgi:hypothetical protein
MFQAAENPSERIFFFLGFEKSVLYEFAYVMFLIGEWA